MLAGFKLTEFARIEARMDVDHGDVLPFCPELFVKHPWVIMDP